MELFKIEGLRADDFIALVFMASDAKHAQAVREFCALAKSTPHWIVDSPDVAIDNACQNANFTIEFDALKLLVQRIEVLAAARGVLLPNFWQVIY
jgi:hypothetical protein